MVVPGDDALVTARQAAELGVAKRGTLGEWILRGLVPVRVRVTTRAMREKYRAGNKAVLVRLGDVRKLAATAINPARADFLCPPGYVSPAVAAERLRLSRPSVIRLCAEGKLACRTLTHGKRTYRWVCEKSLGEAVKRAEESERRKPKVDREREEAEATDPIRAVAEAPWLTSWDYEVLARRRAQFEARRAAA